MEPWRRQKGKGRRKGKWAKGMGYKRVEGRADDTVSANDRTSLGGKEKKGGAANEEDLSASGRALSSLPESRSDRG
jgi:hypothetical protein